MRASILRLLALWLLSPVAFSSEPSLKYTVASSQTLPLADITLVNGQYEIDTENGFLVLLGKEISQALGLNIEISTIPRGEIDAALLSGDSDMVCYLTPQWTPEIRDSVDWSKPFMVTKDILVSKSKVTPIKQVEDLKGKTVGVIENYSYPLIDHLIENKDIRAVYSQSEANIFIQLFKNPDLDAIVLKELIFEWLSHKHSTLTKDSRVTIHPLVIELIEPKCAVARHKKLNLERINQGIANFKDKYGFE